MDLRTKMLLAWDSWGQNRSRAKDTMTYQDFIDIWTASGMFEYRGKGRNDYCLRRPDPTQPWSRTNAEVVQQKNKGIRRR